jgi:hypothetical protein
MFNCYDEELYNQFYKILIDKKEDLKIADTQKVFSVIQNLKRDEMNT